MSRPNSPRDRVTAIPLDEDEWPRDFDFREAYAEQRELLDEAALCRETPAHAQGAECND